MDNFCYHIVVHGLCGNYNLDRLFLQNKLRRLDDKNECKYNEHHKQLLPKNSDKCLLQHIPLRPFSMNALKKPDL